MAGTHSDDKTIQGVMRYTELRTTMSIYVKPDEKAAREGVSKVGKAFSKVVSIRESA